MVCFRSRFDLCMSRTWNFWILGRRKWFFFQIYFEFSFSSFLRWAFIEVSLLNLVQEDDMTFRSYQYTGWRFITLYQFWGHIQFLTLSFEGEPRYIFTKIIFICVSFLSAVIMLDWLISFFSLCIVCFGSYYCHWVCYILWICLFGWWFCFYSFFFFFLWMPKHFHFGNLFQKNEFLPDFF